MNQEKIGLFIAQLRKEKGLTQDELAERLGVTNKSVSRWENGRTMPDYSILKELCDILGITVGELINGEKIKKDKIIEEYDNNLVKVLKEYKRMKKTKNIILIVLCAILYHLILGGLLFSFLYFSYESAKVDINTDISKYNQYIGPNAIYEYQNKWEMEEAIFPESITDNMNVLDYKMVYYNPWDAQYLSYLVVEYNDEDYLEEVSRLKEYKSTNYIGYYNVTGFTKYELLAMNADSYQGFIYALTDNNNKIIYVELIFCNYFYDLDYTKYINTDYLPDDFDAHIDNSYQQKMLSK